MNDIGKANGKVVLEVDRTPYIANDQLVFRKQPDVYPEGFTFSTWFGGSDDTWSPPTTVEAYFKNFKMYSIA